MVFQFLFGVKKFPYLIAGTSSFKFLQQIWKEKWIYKNKKIELFTIWTDTISFLDKPKINWEMATHELKMPAFKNLNHLEIFSKPLIRITEYVYPKGMRYQG